MTYWPLAEILKRHTGVLDSDGPKDAVGKVRETVQDLLDDGGQTDSVRGRRTALALAVGLDDPVSPLLDVEPRQVRFEISSAWRSYFWALAQQRPAIVHIEDLHWAGAAMLDLLEELTDRVEAPVMFLGTAHRELTTAHPDGGPVRGTSPGSCSNPWARTSRGDCWSYCSKARKTRCRRRFDSGSSSVPGGTRSSWSRSSATWARND